MSAVSALVIVPTYNERQNLPALVERRPGASAACACSSSTTSRRTARARSPTISRGSTRAAIDVLHRTGKRGLGRSYVDGIAQRLHSRCDLVCQMDADLSHDPQHLPALIEAADRRRRRDRIALHPRWPRGELAPSPAASEPVREPLHPSGDAPERRATARAATAAGGGRRSRRCRSIASSRTATPFLSSCCFWRRATAAASRRCRSPSWSAARANRSCRAACCSSRRSRRGVSRLLEAAARAEPFSCYRLGALFMPASPAAVACGSERLLSRLQRQRHDRQPGDPRRAGRLGADARLRGDRRQRRQRGRDGGDRSTSSRGTYPQRARRAPPDATAATAARCRPVSLRRRKELIFYTDGDAQYDPARAGGAVAAADARRRSRERLQDQPLRSAAPHRHRPHLPPHRSGCCSG